MAMKTNRALEVVQSTYGVDQAAASKMLRKAYEMPVTDTCLKTYLTEGFLPAIGVANAIFDAEEISVSNIIDVLGTSNHIRNSTVKGAAGMASVLFGTLFRGAYRYLNQGLACPENVSALLNGKKDFTFAPLEHRLFVVAYLFQELQTLGESLDTPTISVPQAIDLGEHLDMAPSLDGIYAEEMTDGEKAENELLRLMTEVQGRKASEYNFNKVVHNAAKSIQDEKAIVVRNLYDGADVSAIMAGAENGWLEYTINFQTWAPIKMQLRKVATYINLTVNADSKFKIDVDKGAISLAQKCANTYFSLLARERLLENSESRLLTLIGNGTPDAVGNRTPTPKDGYHARDNELYRKSDKFVVKGSDGRSEPYAGTNCNSSKLEEVQRKLNAIQNVLSKLGDIPLNLLDAVNAAVMRNNAYDGKKFEMGAAAGCLVSRHHAVHAFIISHLDDDAEGWREFACPDGVTRFFKNLDTSGYTRAIVSALINEWGLQKSAKSDPATMALLKGIAPTILKTEVFDMSPETLLAGTGLDFDFDLDL